MPDHLSFGSTTHTGEHIITETPVNYGGIAALYLANNFKPIPVRGKTPVPEGATGATGTVTAKKVADWVADPAWAEENVALRAEGYVALDVDDYGTHVGAAELAALELLLGELPATITSTSRGQGDPSRQAFYSIPEGTILRGKAGNSIEICQRHHRYSVVYPSFHPLTGAQYEWYGYDGEPLGAIPNLNDFEALPLAWIEHLRAGMRDFSDPDRPVAKTAAVQSQTETRMIARILRDIDGLPATWAEGCGWHDTVFGSSCWLSRMANTAEYMLTAEQALALLLERVPTYPQWGQDEIVVQWESARKITANQLADLPDSDEPAALHDFLSTSNLLPMYTSRGNPFSDLLFTEPEVVTATTISDARATLLHEIFRAGLTESQAATLAYHAKVGAPLQQAPDGITALWAEVATAKAFVTAQALQATTDGQAAPAPTTDPRERAPKTQDRERRISFLTEAEREYVLESGECSWHGTRYMDWTRSLSKAFNAPYHRFNRWTPLSLKFSPVAEIFFKDGNLGLNIYQILVGKTTTGKTAAAKLQKQYMRSCSPTGESFNIGGDVSPNALIEVLIERDGKSSVSHVDEAHGIFKLMNTPNGYMSSLREKWTDLYEGEVPIIQRKNAKELSGIEAATHYSLYMMSTLEDMANVIDAGFWTSGFLARFVWCIGEDIKQTPETRALNVRRGPKAKAAPSFTQQWAGEHDHAIRKIGEQDASIAEIDFSEEAIQRLEEFGNYMAKIVTAHRHEDRLLPTGLRFMKTIIKCAGIIASSEATDTIELRHVLIAVEQAEEWWANIVHMAATTDDTPFTRSINQMEKLIASNHGREMRKEAIYEYGPGGSVRANNELIQELVARGRAKEVGPMVICNDEGA